MNKYFWTRTLQKQKKTTINSINLNQESVGFRTHFCLEVYFIKYLTEKQVRQV